MNNASGDKDMDFNLTNTIILVKISLNSLKTTDLS